MSASKAAQYRSFGATFLGPIVALFFGRFSAHLNSHPEINHLRFLAREGYVLQRIYNTLKGNGVIKDLPSSYLLCSRTLLFKLSLANRTTWPLSLEHHYTGTLLDLLKHRYQFTDVERERIVSTVSAGNPILAQEIELPRDQKLVVSFFETAQEAILNITKSKKNLYLKYLKSINFGSNKNEHEHVIDIGYAGTIQKLISKLTGTATTGHYFITTKKASNTKNTKFVGHILEGVNFGDGHSILDRSLFIETLMTAPHGQVVDLFSESNETRFKYGQQTAAQFHFEIIEHIIDGAAAYASEALKDSNFMSTEELNSYYNVFVETASLFDGEIGSVFEIDDTISGLGIINPIFHFAKKN